VQPPVLGEPVHAPQPTYATLSVHSLYANDSLCESARASERLKRYPETLTNGALEAVERSRFAAPTRAHAATLFDLSALTVRCSQSYLLRAGYGRSASQPATCSRAKLRVCVRSVRHIRSHMSAIGLDARLLRHCSGRPSTTAARWGRARAFDRQLHARGTLLAGLGPCRPSAVRTSAHSS
jgi:hypothetical protein